MSMLATVLKSLASSDEIVRDLKSLNLQIDSLIRNLRQVKKELPASPEAVREVLATASAGVVVQAEPTLVREPKNSLAVIDVAASPVGVKLIGMGATAALPLFADGGMFASIPEDGIGSITMDELSYYLEHLAYVDQFGHNADCFDLDIFQFWRKDTQEAQRLKEHPQVLLFPNGDGDGVEIFAITPENYRKVRDVRDIARAVKRRQLEEKKVKAAVAAGDLE